MSASAGDGKTPAWTSWIPAASLGIWAVLRIGTWFGRDFTHDDFYFAYASWLRAIKSRPGIDTDAFLYSPLAELFAPAFRLWPETFVPLDLARGFVLAVALALLGSVYVVSRRLGAPVPWALAAVSFAAWERDFVFRISDIRTDPVGALLLVASFLLLLREEENRPLLAGICFGSAVFFSVKLAVAVPAMALAVALTSRRAPIRALLRYAAGGLIGTVFWLSIRALSDGWAPIVEGFRALAGSTEGPATAPSSEFLLRMVRMAPVSAFLLVLGALGAIGVPLLRRGRREPLGAPETRRLVYASAVLVFLAVFLGADPYLFPYNFVVLMPMVSPLLAGLPDLLPSRPSRSVPAILLALAVVVPVSEGAGAFAATAGRTSAVQRAVVKWIWDATAPTERVFDWQGMHWGRRGTYHWWMFSGWVPAYQAGARYSVADELKASRVTLVIDNYRLRWLNRPDREFFESHYVRLDHCLFAPGRAFRLEEARDGADFDLVAAGFYRIDPREAASGVLIDGVPASSVRTLAAGRHRLSPAPGSTPSSLRLLFTTLRRERAGLPCPTPQILHWGF